MNELIRIELCEGTELMIELTPQMVKDLRICNNSEVEAYRNCAGCSWKNRVFSVFAGEDIAICCCDPVINAVFNR